MNLEILTPYLIILTPFTIAFLLEAVVIYSFKMKRPWPALGVSILINLISLALFFYAAVPLIGKLNYEVNGLHFPLQLFFFIWWFCTVTDGFLLRLFLRNQPAERIFKVSAVMNACSTLFFYFFIVNSH